MKRIIIILIIIGFNICSYAQSQRVYLEGLQYNALDISTFAGYAKDNLSYINSNKAGPEFSKDSIEITALLNAIDSIAQLIYKKTESITLTEEIPTSDEAPPSVEEPVEEREYKSDFENKEDEDSFGNPMVDQINPLKKKKTKFVIETGINDFVIADNNFTNAEVSPGRSWFWNYSLMKQISKSKSMVIEIGISYLTNRFSIENEVALTRNGNDNLPYQFQKFNNASKNPCLSVSYLQIPLNFKFNLGKSFYANIGVFGGYRVGSTQQLEYSIGTEEVKEERKDSYDLNKWNYGGRLGIGIKSWDLFFNYNLSNLFRSEEIYKYNIYSIGTSFRI